MSNGFARPSETPHQHRLLPRSSDRERVVARPVARPVSLRLIRRLVPSQQPGVGLLAHLVDLRHRAQQADALLQGAQRKLPSELLALQERAATGLAVAESTEGTSEQPNWGTKE